MRWSRPLILVLLLGGSTPAWAAESAAQVWGATFLQANLTEQVPRLHLWLDLQARHAGGAATTLVRPALGLQLFDGALLHVGYGWIARFPDADLPEVHEHRIWEQLLFTHSVEATGLDLMMRVRLEQRLLATGGTVAHRLRTMLRAGWWPDREAALLFVLWDEAFLGIEGSDWGATSGFDQNRLFAGLGVKGLAQTRFELGYLSLYLRRSSGEDRLDHVASFNLFANF
ncbi:MAG: DUF2490 domain-containing protein [Deltaproteobacteria bacterium]|nr:DUF2490 domain-containing protein [Deltaproteobacteria bacterium]